MGELEDIAIDRGRYAELERTEAFKQSNLGSSFPRLIARQAKMQWRTPVVNLPNSIKRPRQAPAQQKHVVLSTHRENTEIGELDPAIYTTLKFGSDGQPIALQLAAGNITWVPNIKALNSFCGNHSVSAKACGFAKTSGYYSPSSNSTSVPFSLGSSSFSNSDSVNGYWYDDVVTAGAVPVDFRFGVGDSWNIPPFLGLGLNSSSSSSYVTTLVEQGKIHDSYISFYDVRNPRATGGQIVIGGVDRKKIYGNFDSWKSPGAWGEVPTPKVKVFSNSVFAETDSIKFEQPKESIALINPWSPYLVVPPDLLKSIRLHLETFTFPYGRNDLLNYLFIDCDDTIDPDAAIEFEFDTVVIKIPLADLKTVDAPRAETSVHSRAYVVMKPGNSTTASITGIAIAKLKEEEEEIIDLGGPSSPDLSQISGDEPAATERKKRITILLASTLGGGGGSLFIVLTFLFLKYRKRFNLAAEPSIPSPDPDFIWQTYLHRPQNPPV
ncbi:hypothetical protein TWF481_006357 [Arthrobotrys musiformis]|uniref:Peptidase A1 domain-containing protein n=1 Tax=Arthrobotrys musiformis TaxID=47236 RepID=A0AAV9WI25_9PEZI